MEQNAAIEATHLVMPAKQTRSRAQAERIIAAGIELLAETDFEALSVEQITDRAGCSPATLYRRFKDKESLLTVLADRISLNIVNDMPRARLIGDRPLDNLEDIVERLVGYHVGLYRKYSGLMRAMLVRRLRQQGLDAPMHQVGLKMIEQALNDAKRFRPENIPCETFEYNFRAAMQMVNGTLIRSIIFPQGPLYLSHDAMIHELTRMVMSFIQSHEAEQQD